jgi:hypothetical protein
MQSVRLHHTRIALAIGVLSSLALFASGCGGGAKAGKSCAQITCGAHQLCQEHQGSTDAKCEMACTSGFMFDAASMTCIPNGSMFATCLPAPAPGSILAQCNTGNRTCVEPIKGQAMCGVCMDGFVDNMGTCITAHTCADLHCDMQNRACDMNPTGHCTTCLAGFIEDPTNMMCRAPVTCMTLMCTPGTHCVNVMGGDAMCAMGNGCPGSMVPTPTGNMCVTCQVTCNGRVGGTGNIYSDLTTAGGECICETMRGYFWDDGAMGGGAIEPCDGDGDGWVRLSAQRYIEGMDLALQINARCTVNKIDRFITTNDFGESQTTMLGSPLSLYEQPLDDGNLLHDAVTSGELPTYNGRELKAEELNPLTKACVGKTLATQHADFNANGTEDVDEAHNMPPVGTDPLSAFENFTYFIETHRGWYEPPSMGGTNGAYHIEEKGRDPTMQADPAQRIAFTYGATTAMNNGPYWHDCVRFKDSTYQMGSPGFDFEELDPMMQPSPGWHGMDHHSQFRCIRLVSGSPANTNQLSSQTILNDWVVNKCTVGGTNPAISVPGYMGGNPSDPAVTCNVVTTLPSTSSVSPVLWALAKYAPYRDPYDPQYPNASYVRGCVNECKEFPAQCPGYNPDPTLNQAQCTSNLANFGKLVCGCGLNFAGASCAVSCVSNDLFTSSAFNPATRNGTWMCASPSASSNLTLSGTSTAGMITLRGEVVGNATGVGRICTSVAPILCLDTDPVR